jgi:hypothetical protein
MPIVPDYLADLVRRAQAAADAVAATGAETRDVLVSRVEHARVDAERLAESLLAGAAAAEKDAAHRWSRIQADWQAHLQAARASIQDRQAEREAGSLAKRAEYAERYAELASLLAAAAVQEAEYAALDAALARADALGEHA